MLGEAGGFGAGAYLGGAKRIRQFAAYQQEIGARTFDKTQRIFLG